MTANEKTETEIDVQNEAEKQMGMRQVVLRALSDIAPEVDVDALDPSLELRDQIDLDSVDFLNFVIRLHNQLGIDIPDADVPKLGTLNGCIGYVLSKGKRTI
jgi:acyl carrier protein